MTKRNAVVIAAIAVVVLALLARWTVLGRNADDMALLECTNLYARAATAADSLLIDTTHPTQQPRGVEQRVTCGELRR